VTFVFILLERNIFVLNGRSVCRIFLMSVALVEVSACARRAGGSAARISFTPTFNVSAFSASTE
jgi:hypothetical protein